MANTHEHHHTPSEVPPAHTAPDKWHDHSHDTERPMHGHAEVANAGRIMATGLALFMVIVVSVIVVYGYYTYYTTSKLQLSERKSSIGPSTDALKYKRDSIHTQHQGGETRAAVLVGSDNKLLPVSQKPIFDPSSPNTLNADLMRKAFPAGWPAEPAQPAAK